MTTRWKKSKIAREIYQQSKSLDFQEIFSLFFGIALLLLFVWGWIKVIKLIILVC